MRTWIQIAAVMTSMSAVQPAFAETRYVSASGGGSTCTYDAPCRTLNDAVISATSGDTIFCQTSPGASALNITKSLSIDCSSAKAPQRDFLTYGTFGTPRSNITINIPPSDKLRTVRLRGIHIDGGDVGVSQVFADGRIYERGIHIVSAAAVFVEDCVIENIKQAGILDVRTGGQTRLYVKDTMISNVTGSAIVAGAAAVGIVVLDNIRLENNAYGIAAATGNNVFISRSTISGNTTAGVEADPGAQVNVSNSTLSHNAVHVQASGAVRLRENDLSFSNIAVQGAAVSMGANRFSGNGSIGTAPSLATGAPADVYN